MNKILSVVMVVVCCISLSAQYAEAKRFTLTSGVSVRDACFEKSTEKTLILSNTSGTTTWSITEDGVVVCDNCISLTYSASVPSIKYVTNHAFNSIAVTATGGSGAAQVLRCYE